MSTQLMTQEKPQTLQAKPASSLLQRAAITPVAHGTLQRCTNGVECPACRQKRIEHESTLQRASVNSTPTNTVPPIVHDVLNSPGQPLDAGTRAFMEPRFGHDFSGVRVHTDERAAESARSVNALAYTVGRNVVFGTGQYAPGTSGGRRLMAHELTHTIQQGTNPQQQPANLTLSSSGSSSEREAASIANTIMQDHKVSSTFTGSAEIARQDTDTSDTERMDASTSDAGATDTIQDASLPGGVSTPALTPVSPSSVSGVPPVPRPLDFVTMKRKPIAVVPKGSFPFLGMDYGHWWTEIDGTESYGWWPKRCPVTLKETLFGTDGELNGVGCTGMGDPTHDPYHGDPAPTMFHPILTLPKSDATVRTEMRSFATSYSGEWRWTFGYGQNCRTFQKSMMAKVGMVEP